MEGNDDNLHVGDAITIAVDEYAKYDNSIKLVEKSKSKPLGMLNIKNMEKITELDSHLKLYQPTGWFVYEYHIDYKSLDVYDPKTHKVIIPAGKLILSRMPKNGSYQLTDGENRLLERIPIQTITDVNLFIDAIWMFIGKLHK